jgi:regulator of nucleoside diphosphate kinase
VPFIVSICTVCGGAIAAAVETCYACDTAGTGTAPRSGGDHPGAPTALTVRDFAALERFARLCLQPDSPAARALLEKLDQSRIMRTEAVAARIATLGSRVVFSTEDGQPEARVLVLRTRHTAAGWTLPVTAPRGMALLGRAAGAVVSVVRHDGDTERLHLLAVAQVPESGRVAAPEPSTAPRPILYRSLARALPVPEFAQGAD